MNPELTQKLVKRFPILYQDYRSAMDSTCMCWGFSHGDGWFNIIWQLSLAIEDELRYSRWQRFSYPLKKRLSQRWNRFIYRISPPLRDEYKSEGNGTAERPWRKVLVKKDRGDILARFFRRLRPRWMQEDWHTEANPLSVHRHRWWLLGLSWGQLESGLKALIWFPYTGFAVTQVKEKFGTLRYYCPSTDAIDRYIRYAETLSYKTCEKCGEPGKLFTDGWWYVACPKHTEIGDYMGEEEAFM